MCSTSHAPCARCAAAVPAGVTFCPTCKPVVFRFKRAHNLCWSCAGPLSRDAHNYCTRCGAEVNQSAPVPRPVSTGHRAALPS